MEGEINRVCSHACDKVRREVREKWIEMGVRLVFFRKGENPGIDDESLLNVSEGWCKQCANIRNN